MPHQKFEMQPQLTGETLHLRGLTPDDFDGLFAAASDPLIWAGHPVKDRYQRPVFEPYFHFLLENGGTLVIIDRKTSKIIGCSRYYVASDQPDSISIGFTFLNNNYWGGTTNSELKHLMFAHAFSTFDEVWFHIAPDNIRSQKATAKIGARYICDAMLSLAGAPALWKCYRLTKGEWVAGEKADAVL
jgi:N-acetyltransferase